MELVAELREGCGCGSLWEVIKGKKMERMARRESFWTRQFLGMLSVLSGFGGLWCLVSINRLGVFVFFKCLSNSNFQSKLDNLYTYVEPVFSLLLPE